MNPMTPENGEGGQLPETTAEFVMGETPVTDSDHGFDLSPPRVAPPSEVVRSAILHAFHLSQEHPALPKIDASLSEIDREAALRNPAYEHALGFLFSNPQALPVVRERLDRRDDSDFTIESADGRKFLVITPIGKGGFGAAYLVEDPSFQPEDRRHTQVIKQLTAVPVASERKQGKWVEAGADPNSTVFRFNREAGIAAALTEGGMGPMTPRYLGKGERVVLDASGLPRLYPYIQYEFAHCLALDQLRHAGTDRMSLSAFNDLAAHIGATVHSFHRARFIHRDVKPGNFLVRSDGQAVMIIDFGFAVGRGEDQFDPDVPADTRFTQSNAVFGTSKYMAPEQWAGAAHVTPAADWYSTYLALFNALTGNDVFAGDNHAALYKAHVMESPEPALKTLKSLGLPAPMVDLFRRGMAKDPADRPQGDEALETLLKHSSYKGLSPTQFIESIKRGESPFRLPEELRSTVSKPDAPFLSGFPDTGGDHGASKMFEAFQQYPGGVAEVTRSKARRLLVPAVAIGAVALTALGVSVMMQQSRDKTGKAAAGAVQKNPTPEVVKTPTAKSLEFASSDLFQGVVENGKLKQLTILKGTPAECSFSEDELKVQTRDGQIYSVTMKVPLEFVEKYVGKPVDEITSLTNSGKRICDVLHAENGTTVRLTLNPATGSYALFVDLFGLVTSNGKDLKVFCAPQEATMIRNALHLKEPDDARYVACVRDEDLLHVIKGLDAEFDAPSAAMADDQKSLKEVVDGWKKLLSEYGGEVP